VLGARADLGVEHGTKGGEQLLAGLGIQVPVHPHHPAERDRGGKAPARTQHIGTLGVSLAVHACPPEREDPSQLGYGVHPGGGDQDRLGAFERLVFEPTGRITLAL
jgi:hypothetical protein